MNVYKFFRIVFLLTWSTDIANGFCDKFPFGHTCRNIDLTGFCLQVSQLIKIRESARPVKPYLQFDKIFYKLVNDVQADKPFVYFGGYKRGRIWPCIHHKCTPQTTGSSTTAGPVTGPPGTPAPPAPPPCPPGPPPAPAPCPAPDYQAGPPAGTDTTVMTYEGCEEDCECCVIPPVDNLATGTIFSLQDGCELKYMKAPISKAGGAINPIAKDTKAKTNPYRLSVTQVKVRGHYLHNWLHVRIHSIGNADLNTDDLGSGKIKMAFLVVTDAMGFPVGEFVNTLPCGPKCNCTNSDTESCHQGTPEDTIPCMFDGFRVVTNTAMMMVHGRKVGPDEGFNEIHATWRFSQSTNVDNFITELHFKALVLDEFGPFKMLFEDGNNLKVSGMSERRIEKEGLFGWNPVYDILHPTENTIGASDYFREDVYADTDVNCHAPLQDELYVVEPYPDSGEVIRQLQVAAGIEGEHCYRLNDTNPAEDPPPPPPDNIDYCFATTGPTPHQRTPIRCPGLKTKVSNWFHDAYGFIKDNKADPKQIYPWTLFGARTESYVIRDGALDRTDWTKYIQNPPDTKLYWGTEKSELNSLQYAECDTGGEDRYYGKAHNHEYPGASQNYDIQGKYGHFCTSDGAGRRVLNLPGGPDQWPNILAKLWKFPPVTAISYLDDRCYCPSIPPTPNPRYKEPPEVQVQGRRQHAYQMIIAWNCIVPFGIFVSRYYKETYSKVFFLQEYWWFTIHVLCMVSAAMFTFGGIYVMELKRRDPVNWLDPNITTHVIIGYIIISVFFFQVCTGFFRVRDPKRRLFNIFTHWLLGVLEYLLAVVCMINASFILLSGMTCEGVVALGFLLMFQIMFYASMEVHMRNIDKLLKLNPPRSYLPPPIMRVFHKDAPDAKFRIHVLIAYFGLCVITSIIQFISMESNTLGESCFIKSRKYIDPTDLVE